MRRRLRKFLPIVLIALAVQILAPIGACWAASIAASDPLHAAPICTGSATSATDQTGQTGRGTHDGACAMCCLAHVSASLDTPEASFAAPLRQAERVVWIDATPERFGPRPGWHAQARAPPSDS
ncbi:DUF2946 domain-containing protein [Bradyrhizobium sp.]|uniref:DUF2946 domain-containing protein n=1 Tax=Bradyrhizobium sp. TaxID=376 RepID=UPI0027352238|nr:DUF2946 domain-containing protein [Bradyrhizobium sp.]MDP3693764.1 DUF2946 domain-containing protein [Bradyrhizobium sp.]